MNDNYQTSPPATSRGAQPSPARIYDYLLGGTRHYAVDRAAAEQIRAALPEAADAARANRAFHHRAAIWMAHQGITQFVDAGCGLPAQSPTHWVLQQVNPAARVVYADHDRYLPASLALQRLDGIDPEVIWQLNAGAYVPDLAVLLNAEHPVIAERLRARGTHSRFERQPGSSRAESDLYHMAAAELRAVGWPVMTLDCTTQRPETIAMTIAIPVLHTHTERRQA